MLTREDICHVMDHSDACVLSPQLRETQRIKDLSTQVYEELYDEEWDGDVYEFSLLRQYPVGSTQYLRLAAEHNARMRGWDDLLV